MQMQCQLIREGKLQVQLRRSSVQRIGTYHNVKGVRGHHADYAI